MKIERSVEIARDQDDVWSVLRDPALMPEWFENFSDFQTVLGDGTQVGDRYTIDYVRDSGPVQLSVEILQLDEGSGHVHLFKGLPVAFSIESTLSSSGGSTTWLATIEVKLSLMQKALAPVIKGTLDGLADDMAESFKTYVEAE